MIPERMVRSTWGSGCIFFLGFFFWGGCSIVYVYVYVCLYYSLRRRYGKDAINQRNAAFIIPSDSVLIYAFYFPCPSSVCSTPRTHAPHA